MLTVWSAAKVFVTVLRAYTASRYVPAGRAVVVIA
jgi:hypothetical protein